MRIHLPKKTSTDWQKWFAWYPVVTRSGYLVWMERVWWYRTYPDYHHRYWTNIYHVNYRVLDMNNILVDSPYSNSVL